MLVLRATHTHAHTHACSTPFAAAYEYADSIVALDYGLGIGMVGIGGGR